MNPTEEKFVRDLIKNILTYILKEIPDNDDGIKNTHAKEEFTSLYRSLPYKAPEILLGFYDNIRKVLAARIPIDQDDSKNPQWKKNILNKWITSCFELDNKLLPSSKDNQSNIPN